MVFEHIDSGQAGMTNRELLRKLLGLQPHPHNS
jgi:hypothetical protein